MEVIFKCLALVACGIAIGAIAMWRVMYTPPPMTREKAKREAEKLYAKLLQEVGE